MKRWGVNSLQVVTCCESTQLHSEELSALHEGQQFLFLNRSLADGKESTEESACKELLENIVYKKV